MIKHTLTTTATATKTGIDRQSYYKVGERTDFVGFDLIDSVASQQCSLPVQPAKLT